MPTPAHQNGPPAACPFFGPLEALPGVPQQMLKLMRQALVELRKETRDRNLRENA